MHQLGNRCHLHLFHDVGSVYVHGLGAQVEHRGNLFGCVSIHHAAHHLALAIGQSIQAILGFHMAYALLFGGQTAFLTLLHEFDQEGERQKPTMTSPPRFSGRVA